ncbi:MAG: phosphonate C-P lyase system protein PhnH [Xanthobacteraceae bacterium]|nr:phosphonate C-P lyase system protein PhnH [Xanthobacteraceae bacterium]
MTLHVNLDAAQGNGFADPVRSSQSVFRCVMNALARPGTIETVADNVNAPAPLMPAAAALALTLCDHDTPVWLDEKFAGEPGIAAWLRFQTGAPVLSDPRQAAFAFIGSGAALPPFDTFTLGTPDYPDRSTTLVIQVDTLSEGPALPLSGPGIRGTSTLGAGTLPHDFAMRMQANRAMFPLGVDLVLVCGTQFVALPRSTHVAAKEI